MTIRRERPRCARPAFLAAALLAAASAAAQSGPPPSLPPEALKEEVDPAKVAYLKTHVVAQGVDRFRFAFPREFYASRLFLVGESHGSAATHAFDLALLENVARKAGVRDYLGEFDPVQAEAFNVYLDRGDASALTRVFDRWKADGSQWSTTSYEAKIRGVRTVNDRLGRGRAIRFHGLDRVQDWAMTRDWLAARDIRVADAAFEAAKTGKDKAALLLTALPAPRGTEPATLAALRVTLGAQATGAGREAVIFANYRALATGPLRRRAGYGMWGLFHVLQAPLAKSVPFAALVAGSRLPAAKRIASVVLEPIDSHAIMPVATGKGFTPMRLKLFNIDGPLAKLDGSADLAAAAPAGQVTVYDLAAARSPYARSADLVAVKTSFGQDMVAADPALPTTRYFRYVGVVRGSDWAPPR